MWLPLIRRTRLPVLMCGLLVEEALHPRPGGIDQAARLQLHRGAVGAGQLDVPQLAVVAAPRRHAAMAGEDAGAHLARRLQVGDHQAGVVDPGVGIDEAVLERRLQARAELGARQVDRDRLGQGHVPVEMVVEEEAQPQHPARPQMRLVRQHEAQRKGEVRRLGQKHLALLQGLAHQPELVVLEIAQAAMDQLGRSRRGGAGKIVHLAQPDLERPSHRIAGDACAVDSAADHEKVERRFSTSIHGDCRHIARLTHACRDRKWPHGVFAQDHPVRRRRLRRVEDLRPLEGPVRQVRRQARRTCRRRADRRRRRPLPARCRARKAAIEETVQCAGCGAYIPASAEKCGQCGRPQPRPQS